jgi:nucleotide-binding universal stress UspA family protein
MTTSAKSLRSFCIVVGLDFTDAGGFAFDQAAMLARRIPGSHLHIVHAFDQQPSREAARELVGRLRTYVNEKAQALEGLPGVTVGIHLREGKPARELAQLAQDVSADLIVLGSQKGPHLKSWLVGSVAEKLIATASCPVVVAGPKPAVTEAEAHEPKIEPACPDCLKTRAATRGEKWWCERHGAHAIKAHIFSYQRELPLALHDSEVIPTVIDF